MKSDLPYEEIITEAAGYRVTTHKAHTDTGDKLLGTWKDMVRRCEKLSRDAGAPTYTRKQAMQRLARMRQLKIWGDMAEAPENSNPANLDYWQAGLAEDSKTPRER